MTGSAVPQIIRCYYHQHPEDYGRGYAEDGDVPASMRYGPDTAQPSSEVIPEEPMGHPEAVPV
jgi:hypothetical protein